MSTSFAPKSVEHSLTFHKRKKNQLQLIQDVFNLSQDFPEPYKRTKTKQLVTKAKKLTSGVEVSEVISPSDRESSFFRYRTIRKTSIRKTKTCRRNKQNKKVNFRTCFIEVIEIKSYKTINSEDIKVDSVQSNRKCSCVSCAVM